MRRCMPLTFMDNLFVSDNLYFFAFLNNTFRDAASSDCLTASSRELNVEYLKNRCFPRDAFLVDGWKQVGDALLDVLYDLINNFRREYGDVVCACGNGGASRDWDREGDDHAWKFDSIRKVIKTVVE